MFEEPPGRHARVGDRRRRIHDLGQRALAVGLRQHNLATHQANRCLAIDHGQDGGVGLGGEAHGGRVAKLAPEGTGARRSTKLEKVSMKPHVRVRLILTMADCACREVKHAPDKEKRRGLASPPFRSSEAFRLRRTW
jgi:hypothetical protein